MRTRGLQCVVRAMNLRTTIPRILVTYSTSTSPPQPRTGRAWGRMINFTYVRTWPAFAHVSFIINVFPQKTVS